MLFVAPVDRPGAERWAEMRCALWPDLPLDESRAEVAGWFAGDRRHVHVAFVARDGDALVGFIEVGMRGYAEGCASSPVPFVEGWFVAAGHRGRGIGRLLMRAAEDWARAQGCTEMASDALVENGAGIAAHHAAGFEDVDTIVCFRKSL